MDYKVSIEKLKQNISEYWRDQLQSNIIFDRVMIESLNELLFFSEKGFRKANILNLW